MSGERCGNPVCTWDDRYIDVVHAISRRTGAIEGKLKALKYDGQFGWATIFGRIVVGWLDANLQLANSYDLIVVNPTHASRATRHTELILQAAAAEDQLAWWPFEPWDDTTLVKHTQTAPSSVAHATWRTKKAAADELWFAVRVEHPDRVRGRRILVLDDATTTLHQLNVIAGILKAAGAAEVDGLVIARSH